MQRPATFNERNIFDLQPFCPIVSFFSLLSYFADVIKLLPRSSTSNYRAACSELRVCKSILSAVDPSQRRERWKI